MNMSASAAKRQVALTQQQILDIVERAAFLRERMLGPYESVECAGIETDRRLEEWKQTVADGDPERFARRLSWVGLNPDDAVSCVSDVRLNAGHSLPNWSGTLQSYMVRAGNCNALPCAAGVDPGEAIAFEQLLTPLVALAADRVVERTVAVQVLHEQAFHALQRSLLKRLSTIAGRCFHLVFSTFRSQSQMSTGMYGTWPGIVSRHLYERFVDHMLSGGLAACFVEYPVLARYLTTAADLWVDSTIEFFNRLQQDIPLLGKQFQQTVSPGDVVHLKAGLSDFHKGGLSAILVRFESGLEVFYKPKPLRSEQLYYELLDYLRANDKTDGLASFRVLAASTGGPNEFLMFHANHPKRSPVTSIGQACWYAFCSCSKGRIVITRTSLHPVSIRLSWTWSLYCIIASRITRLIRAPGRRLAGSSLWIPYSERDCSRAGSSV
jgi:hypothetical protein